MAAAPTPAAFARLLGADVPVFAGAVDPAAVAPALASRPFKEWAAALDARFAVASLTLQSVDFFGPRVGFVKLLADATFNGARVPGVVFLRGGAVSVLPLLLCEGERWAVCARQPRLAVGAHFLELPAGMLDDGGSFVGVAAKELAEETGITIAPSDLVDLTALAFAEGDAGAGGGGAAPGAARRGLYPSVGACDEFIRLLFFARPYERAALEALRGKLTGAAAEDEHITLELVRYEDLWRATADAKTLATVALLDKLVAAGKVRVE